MSITYIALAIAISALVTIFTRAFPFILLSRRDRIPERLLFVAKRLPVAVIAILLFYSVQHVSFSTFSGWGGEVIGILVVVLLHLWKRNTLLSVLLGTLTYMTFISLFA